MNAYRPTIRGPLCGRLWTCTGLDRVTSGMTPELAYCAWRAWCEVAALREELADETALRRKHAARIHELSDTNKELREERNEFSLQASRLKVDNENYDRLLVRKSNQCDAVQHRLADAERRNAALVDLLTEHQWEWQQYDEHYHRDGGYYCLSCKESQKDGHAKGCTIDAALNPKPEAASHDE